MKFAYRIAATDEETSRDGILSLASKIGFFALLYRLYAMNEPKQETPREWVARNISGFHDAKEQIGGTFVCKNPNCKPVTLPGKTEPSAGPGIKKVFKYWTPSPGSKTPECLSCGKPMQRMKG